MGILDGKRLLITGVLTDASLAFGVARLAQEEGAEIVLTGAGRGMRLTERIPIFRSGVHYPDLVVFGAESIDPDTEGLEGIRAAAFFDNDWSLGDDHAVRESPKAR